MNSRKKVSMSLDPVFKFISKLKGLSEASCFQDQFNELHDVLIDCEKHVFIDMEGLQKRMDALKEDCRVLEDDNAVSEMEKSRMRKELKQSRKECQDLKVELEESSRRIAKFSEEQCQITDEKNKAIDYLLKSREECQKLKRELDMFNRIAKFGEQQCVVVADEKNKVIAKLKEKVTYLEMQLQDSELLCDHTLATCREELKESKEEIEIMEKKLQGLMDQELEADQIIERMKHKQINDSDIITDLRRKVKKSIRNGAELGRMECRQENDEKLIIELRHKVTEANEKVEQLVRQNMDTALAFDEVSHKGVEADKLIMELWHKQEQDEKIITELRRKQGEDEKTITKLRRKQGEDAKTITELRRNAAECGKKVKELTRQHMETFEAVVAMKRKKTEDEKLIFELRQRETECSEKFEQLRQQNITTSLAIDAMKHSQIDSENVIVELKHIQFEDQETVRELRRKEAEANKKVEQLRRQNTVTSGAVDPMSRKDTEENSVELRRKELQAHNKIAELMQRIKEASRTVAQLKLEKLEAARSNTEMENQLKEKEKMVGICQQKVKFLAEKVAQTEQELHDLKGQKLAADQIIEELRQNQTASHETMEVQHLEASDKVKQLVLNVEIDKLKSEETLKDMRHKQSQVQQTVEELRCLVNDAHEDVLQAFKMLAEGLMKSLEAEVRDLVSLVLREATDDSLSATEDEKQNSGDSSMGVVRDTDVGIIDGTSTRVNQDVNSTEPACNVLQNTGYTDLALTWSSISQGGGNESKDNAGSSHQANPQHPNSPPGTETDADDQAKEYEKSQGSVVDRNDEASLGDPVCDSGLTAVLGEKRKYCLLSSSSHSNLLINFTPRRKRSSLANQNVNFPNDRQKKNQIQILTLERDDCPSSELPGRPNPGFITALAQGVFPTGSNPELKRCEENVAAASHSPNRIWDVDSSSDGDSSDSDDESCSESSITDILASLKSRKLCKTWMSQADMLRDFQEDVEHCMSAVCVLYRQKISTPGPSADPIGAFALFEEMGGPALAEYLIDGDREYRLRKFLSDIKVQRPEVLVQCRAIAMVHGDKLFSIYCNREDPLFRSR